MKHKRVISANLDHIVKDRRSGSAQIAHDFLELIVCENHSNSDIDEMCRIIAEAFPSMALIQTITRRLMASDRNRVLTANKLLKKLDDSDNLIAKKAQRVIPDGAKVLTISQSRTIFEIFRQAKEQGKKLHVFLSYGYPENDGREHAEKIRDLGFRVTIFPDLAYGRFVQSVDLVLSGADQSSDDMFVNRTGTLALALLANYFRKPFYVAATKMKEMEACDLTLEERHELDKGIEHVFPIFDLISNRLVTGEFIGE